MLVSLLICVRVIVESPSQISRCADITHSSLFSNLQEREASLAGEELAHVEEREDLVESGLNLVKTLNLVQYVKV